MAVAACLLGVNLAKKWKREDLLLRDVEDLVGLDRLGLLGASAKLTLALALKMSNGVVKDAVVDVRRTMRETRCIVRPKLVRHIRRTCFDLDLFGIH